MGVIQMVRVTQTDHRVTGKVPSRSLIVAIMILQFFAHLFEELNLKQN